MKNIKQVVFSKKKAWGYFWSHLLLQNLAFPIKRRTLFPLLLNMDGTCDSLNIGDGGVSAVRLLRLVTFEDVHTLCGEIHFQGKPFNITVIKFCVPTTNVEETETDQFYEDLQDLLVACMWRRSSERPPITVKNPLGLCREDLRSLISKDRPPDVE